MYLEDLELGWRARIAGYRVVVDPERGRPPRVRVRPKPAQELLARAQPPRLRPVRVLRSAARPARASARRDRARDDGARDQGGLAPRQGLGLGLARPERRRRSAAGAARRSGCGRSATGSLARYLTPVFDPQMIPVPGSAARREPGRRALLVARQARTLTTISVVSSPGTDRSSRAQERRRLADAVARRVPAGLGAELEAIRRDLDPLLRARRERECPLELLRLGRRDRVADPDLVLAELDAPRVGRTREAVVAPLEARRVPRERLGPRAVRHREQVVGPKLVLLARRRYAASRGSRSTGIGFARPGPACRRRCRGRPRAGRGHRPARTRAGRCGRGLPGRGGRRRRSGRSRTGRRCEGRRSRLPGTRRSRPPARAVARPGRTDGGGRADRRRSRRAGGSGRRPRRRSAARARRAACSRARRRASGRGARDTSPGSSRARAHPRPASRRRRARSRAGGRRSRPRARRRRGGPGAPSPRPARPRPTAPSRVLRGCRRRALRRGAGRRRPRGSGCREPRSTRGGSG